MRVMCPFSFFLKKKTFLKRKKLYESFERSVDNNKQFQRWEEICDMAVLWWN